MAKASTPSVLSLPARPPELQGVTFLPTKDQRHWVRALAWFGITDDDIARQVGCEAQTPRKHLRDGLDHGAAEATAKVAVAVPDATTSKNLAAAISLMVRRGGWCAKPELHDSGEVTQPYVIYTGGPGGARPVTRSANCVRRRTAMRPMTMTTRPMDGLRVPCAP